MLGLGDRNLKIIRETLGVKVTAREGTVQVSGDHDAVAAARDVLGRLGDAADRQVHLGRQQVIDLVGRAAANPRSSVASRAHLPGMDGPEQDRPMAAWDDHLDVYANGQPITAKTLNQQRYLDA